MYRFQSNLEIGKTCLIKELYTISSYLTTWSTLAYLYYDMCYSIVLYRRIFKHIMLCDILHSLFWLQKGAIHHICQTCILKRLCDVISGVPYLYLYFYYILQTVVSQLCHTLCTSSYHTCCGSITVCMACTLSIWSTHSIKKKNH